MADSSSKKTLKVLQKIFIIGSGLAFLGMMVIPLMPLFRAAPPTSEQASSKANPEQLKKLAEGYEKVLAREPNNPSALQGLVETRLQMNDLKGAIAPMEKLVKLYPEQTQLKQLLTAIKQQVALQEKASTIPASPANTKPK
ncbi:tetratricopeptide repeat protein [Synechocystis sp. LKSZ1]|uniref:tetratricopeptide repeat protein n=1 Tax=Synechocystis sp. LKSZ1 TaxID=3144951 RepID=UPI00336BBA8B